MASSGNRAPDSAFAGRDSSGFWTILDAMKVEHWDEGRDGPVSEAARRRKLQERGFSVSRYDYPPGTFFPDHTHGVDVPRGVLHRAEVVGDETVVSLDAVKQA